MEKTVGIIILAAGNSSRLGQPKQLLTYKGKTLLRHVVDQAILVEPAKIIVVTGALSKAIEDELTSRDVTCVWNEHWADGMGTSIKKGLEALLFSSSGISAAIITVCDQPFVGAEILQALINAYYQNNTFIVTSEYSNTFGTPALFDSVHFKTLLELKGAEGAKKIIQNNKKSIISIPFEKGAIDIDTLDDYHKLTKTK